MGKKSNWKKIDDSEAQTVLRNEATKAHTKDAKVDDLFSIDTTANLKAGASASVRKGIQKAVLAPVTVGKTDAHVELLKKTEKKLANKAQQPKPAPKKASVTDVWGDDISTSATGGRIVPVPESIPYAHVPAVPKPSSFEAFNPDAEALKKVLALAAREIEDKEQREKELVEMRRPMTHYLHQFFGGIEEVRVLDDITQQRVFRAANRGVDIALVRAAVLRHKILGDEQPLIGMAQAGIVPENLLPYKGKLSDFSSEIKPEADDEEVQVTEGTFEVVEGLVVKEEEVEISDNEEDVAEDLEAEAEETTDKPKRQKKLPPGLDNEASYSVKKSKHQRNKEERHRLMLQEHAQRRKLKEGLSKDIPIVLKELKQRFKMLKDRQDERKAFEASLRAEEATGVVSRPKKLASTVFREAPKAVALPSEVEAAEGSLRKMKLINQLPVANPISDRFTSYQRRGAVVAAPDVISAQHLFKKRQEAVQAAKARKQVSSNRLNYDESNLA